MASFVIVTVLQGVWDEAQDNEENARGLYLSALSCLAVLALGTLLHLIAPSIGGFLLRQLDDVRLARLLPGDDRRHARWGWKTAKECFATSVVFGLCITAAVLSGGTVPLAFLGRDACGLTCMIAMSCTVTGAIRHLFTSLLLLLAYSSKLPTSIRCVLGSVLPTYTDGRFIPSHIFLVTLSGGGAVLLGLGMTHSVVSASREALPVIRKGWLKRKMSRSKSAMAASSSTQDYSLRGVITLVRSGPTRVVCSPVMLPTFLLWMTHSTICSWPKECTDRLVFLLKVSATTVCTTHLMRPSLPEADAPARGSGGDSSSSGSTTLANKVFVCVCALAAWTLLLPCCLIVFGHQESSEGILAVVLVVTIVALRTRREKTWRGLMLLFWVALLAILTNVACSKLLQQNKVFQRVFSDDVGGPVVPSYLGIFKAMSQLREEGRVAMWTVCPLSAVEGAGRSWFGSRSL